VASGDIATGSFRKTSGIMSIFSGSCQRGLLPICQNWRRQGFHDPNESPALPNNPRSITKEAFFQIKVTIEGERGSFSLTYRLGQDWNCSIMRLPARNSTVADAAERCELRFPEPIHTGTT